MSLSRGMAQSSFVIGFALLGLAFGCVACGAFAMSKLHAGVSSTGLWAIYVSLKDRLRLQSLLIFFLWCMM